MNPENCKDCGVNTYEAPGDYYMVTPEIWNQYGLGGSYWINKSHLSWGEDKPSGMLCMKCLQTRMGRPLRLSDLMDALINTYWFNLLAV